jgi:hypothetical protein
MKIGGMDTPGLTKGGVATERFQTDAIRFYELVSEGTRLEGKPIFIAACSENTQVLDIWAAQCSNQKYLSLLGTNALRLSGVHVSTRPTS